MCHVCFKDDKQPTLVCDFFVSKRVHKVYKMQPYKRRMAPVELKLNKILAWLDKLDKHSFTEWDDSNITRCSTAQCWLDFVGFVEAVKLILPEPIQHTRSL